MNKCELVQELGELSELMGQVFEKRRKLCNKVKQELINNPKGIGFDYAYFKESYYLLLSSSPEEKTSDFYNGVYNLINKC